VPQVTVVMATYRRQALLPRAIESVLAQTLDDWELIVVDDEPSDESRAIVDGFGDRRIRYVAHPVNRGLCAARNTGIEHAAGDLIAFLDDDDEYLPTKLERQVERFRTVDDRVGIVSCHEQVLQAGGGSIVRAIELEGDMHRTLLRNDLIRMQPLMVRRTCFEAVGLFDTRLRMHDDFDMTLRLSRAFLFTTVPEPLVRIHADTHTMSANAAHRLSALQVMFTAHPEFREQRPVRSRWMRRLARHHAELGDRAGWRRSMNEALRANPLDPANWVAVAGGPGAAVRLGKLRGRAVRLVRRSRRKVVAS